MEVTIWRVISIIHIIGWLCILYKLWFGKCTCGANATVFDKDGQKIAEGKLHSVLRPVSVRDRFFEAAIVFMAWPMFLVSLLPAFAMELIGKFRNNGGLDDDLDE